MESFYCRDDITQSGEDDVIVVEEAEIQKKQHLSGKDDFIICDIHSEKGTKKRFVVQIKDISDRDSIEIQFYKATRHGHQFTV